MPTTSRHLLCLILGGFMAQSIKNNQSVVIKCMKKKYETIEKVKKLKGNPDT